MSKWQVVEKESTGIDWSPVRYKAYALEHFDDKDKAVEAAVRYLTEVNCDNPLAADEKQSAAECFMMKDGSCFLGMLDGEEWYLCYPKDVVARGKGGVTTVHKKGDKVTDSNYFQLEGKAEVSVREVPGT